MSVTLVEHPLVKQLLGDMRNIKTEPAIFRSRCNQLGALLAYEALRDLPTNKLNIQNWAGTVEAEEIAVKIGAVAVLRAGLGLLDGFLDLFPSASVNIIGMFRDETTLQPVHYYTKFAKDLPQSMAVVLDPMLATGGSTLAAIDLLKKQGCTNIRGIFLVAAPEGIKKIQDAHPEIDLYIAALDDRLNENGYILPGLGDAGDRIFNTVD